MWTLPEEMNNFKGSQLKLIVNTEIYNFALGRIEQSYVHTIYIITIIKKVGSYVTNKTCMVEISKISTYNVWYLYEIIRKTRE